MSTEIQTTQNGIVAPKQFFSQETVKQKFQEILGKRSTAFITSVLQIVASNKLLANATTESIYHSAMVAATLDLPLNNNLGFAYIVPYNQSVKDEQGNWKKIQVAQFQMGYKGFIQLVQRSGQCKSIYATEIYEGQIIEENPLDGYVFDFSKKTSSKVVGYASRIKLINGFESTFYMPVEKIEAHAKRFSQTYKSGNGIWKDDFDSMAKKTVTKLLLSKYAPMTVELNTAVVVDQSVIKDSETLDIEYSDNMPTSIDEINDDKEITRLKEFIENCKTRKELVSVLDLCEQYGLIELYDAKINDIDNGTK